MSDLVTVDREGAVRIVRLDRPEKKNALTSAMYAALAEALRPDPSVAVVVILGAPGAFSAGNDMTDFVAAAASGSLGEPILAFLKALARNPVPLVAGVDGIAVGVGTTLLFHCDLVVASDRSRFRTPFADLGLVPKAASSLLAPRIMGPHRAFELLVAGEIFDAERALLAGFVNRVVTPEAVEETALAFARSLAAKPREAVAASRRLLKGDPSDVLARIDEEAAAFSERLRSPEAQAAFQAFLSRKS